MIDTDRLAAFVGTALVLIATPGPGVLFIVSRGVAVGRRAALATALGHFCGLMVQVSAVAAGVGAIVARSIVVFSVVKLVGAAYLIWLGFQAVRHRHALAAGFTPDEAPVPLARMVRDGAIVGVSNPKGFALFASVLPQFVDPALGQVPVQIFTLGAICGVIALVSDSAWGLTAGTVRHWLGRSPRRLAAVGGAGGLVTMGLGIRLATTGRHD